MQFNYMSVVGNSGTGKTTFVKRLLNSLKYDQLYLCDPNRQYGDYTSQDNATYISPEELRKAIDVIGKRLLLQQKRGVMVVEDMRFTLERLKEVLGVSLSKAKNIIKLLLENLRKYDIKTVIVMHEIDRAIVAKCDTLVFFQVPLSTYQIRTYSEIFKVDLKEVADLKPFHYLMKNGDGDPERGRVEKLESHEFIERDRSFMAKDLLAKCNSLAEKVLVLRLHLDLSNTEISNILNVQRNTVEVLVSRLRKRGIAIPDARRNLNLQNLAF